MDRANVDTDAMVPKQYLKSIKRSGFGPVLFDNWRYLEPGTPDMDHSSRTLDMNFVLNKPEYQGANILLARENFGCGSSREHAPWALADYGFKVIIASSFADIFYNNSFKNGILLIQLSKEKINQLFVQVNNTKGYELEVNLQDLTITLPTGEQWSFEIEDNRRTCLLNGLDDIGITLQHETVIEQYEAHRRMTKPWLFDAIH